jgi:hypothetical protein
VWHKAENVATLKARLEPIFGIPSSQQLLTHHGVSLEIDERLIFKYTTAADCHLVLQEMPLRIRVRLPTGETKVHRHISLCCSVTLHRSYQKPAHQ